jgi:hypothetical protein
MSSFVISKKEYIKAAGIVAGIAEGFGYGFNKFYFWDYETERNSTAEDFYRNFSEFHKMNALSVQEQYNDDTAELNNEEYLDTFGEYMRKGRKATAAPEELKKYFLNLRSFFRSCEYQTEKEAYFWKMKMYFNELLNAIVGYVLPSEVDSWGTLEL